MKHEKKLEGGNGYENMKHGNGMWCNCLMKVGGTGMCKCSPVSQVGGFHSTWSQSSGPDCYYFMCIKVCCLWPFQIFENYCYNIHSKVRPRRLSYMQKRIQALCTYLMLFNHTAYRRTQWRAERDQGRIWNKT